MPPTMNSRRFTSSIIASSTLYLLLVCCCLPETGLGAPSPARLKRESFRDTNMTMVRDVHHKVDGFKTIVSVADPEIYSKIKDPLPHPSSSKTTPDTDATTSSTRTIKLDFSPREKECAPKRYRVSLHFGSCQRNVETTMCFGHCSSYTIPVRHTLTRVANVCKCCMVKSGQLVYIIRTLDCTVDGVRKTKTFHIPKARECSCRVCI